MSQVKTALKQYWPWLLAAGGVGFVVWRYAGAGSDPSVVYNATGASQASVANNQLRAQVANSMGQYAVQMAQIQAQAGVANAQIALATQQAGNEHVVALNTLELQRESLQAQAAVAFQNANAANTTATGAAYAAVLDAMNTPTYAAIQAAALENVATKEAAARVAVAQLQAQAQMATPQPTIIQAPTNNIVMPTTPQPAPATPQNYTWYNGQIIDPNSGKLQQALANAKR